MDILIPAKLVRGRRLRVWGCFEYELYGTCRSDPRHLGRHRDIPLPPDVSENPSHDGALAAIEAQRSELYCCDAVLAYRFVDYEYIQDDRSEWSHESCQTKRYDILKSKQVVVYYSRKFGHRVITMARLANDAKYALDQHGKETTSSEDRRRWVAYGTPFAYEQLKERGIRPRQKLLKLSPVIYFPLDEIEFRPEPELEIIKR